MSERGLYQKYEVERTDGSSRVGGKHEDCDYFVLDLTHDKHATRALKGYIASLREEGEFSMLHEDLEKLHFKMVSRHFPEKLF